MLYYITKLARVNSFSKNFSDNFQHAVLYNVRMRIIKKIRKNLKYPLTNAPFGAIINLQF